MSLFISDFSSLSGRRDFLMHGAISRGRRPLRYIEGCAATKMTMQGAKKSEANPQADVNINANNNLEYNRRI